MSVLWFSEGAKYYRREEQRVVLAFPSCVCGSMSGDCEGRTFAVTGHGSTGHRVLPAADTLSHIKGSFFSGVGAMQGHITWAHLTGLP